MTAYMDLKAWKEINRNPPENWQEKWANREKLDVRSNMASAQKRMAKLQPGYTQPLQIDLHVKDGYVIYYEREEERRSQPDVPVLRPDWNKIEQAYFAPMSPLDEWKSEIQHGRTELGFGPWSEEREKSKGGRI